MTETSSTLAGLVVGLAIATATPAAPPLPNPALPQSMNQALRAPDSEHARTLAGKTAAYVAAGDVAALGRLLASLKTDPGLSDAAREQMLRRALLGLAELKADDASRQLVDELANYASRTMVWREEHGHAEAMLLYDVAAAARFAARRWRETDARDVALEQLARGSVTPVPAYVNGGPEIREGIAEAFTASEGATLVGQRATLLAHLASGADVGRLALVAAARLSDERLFAAVLEKAEGTTAVAAIRQLETDSPGVDRTRLLIAAADRPATASASLLALGRRAPTDSTAADALFARLGSEHGASAAAALARTADEGVIERLGETLLSDRSDRTRRHALLALRLSDSERATGYLRRLATDPYSPEDLRREVPPWLRD